MIQFKDLYSQAEVHTHTNKHVSRYTKKCNKAIEHHGGCVL